MKNKTETTQAGQIRFCSDPVSKFPGGKAVEDEPGRVLLRADHISKFYGETAAVNDVSFSMKEGEILGLLGESGCGKTTLSRMILGLEKPDKGAIYYYRPEQSGGRTDFDNHRKQPEEKTVCNTQNEPAELQLMSEREFRPLRGELQMVQQNPFDSLDPRMEIGRILEEPLKIRKTGKKERQQRVLEMLRECGLPEDCLKKKPGEFSGGQLQRLAIARALLVQPRFLAADEIVSALDVPVQAQILDLLQQLQKKHNLTILFISHDLAVIRRISGRVMVMKEGRQVCCGAAEEILQEHVHPYVDELIRAGFTL